jgi:hypothetical protein
VACTGSPWRRDGIDAELLRDIVPEMDSSTQLTAVGSRLFFAAGTDAAGGSDERVPSGMRKR